MSWTGGNAMAYLLIAGVAATAVWRLAGVLVSGGVAEDGPVIAWVRSVSTALVAGLIARIVVFPPGALADIGTPLRLGAFAFGVAVYFAAGRHMGLGILAATAALIGGHLLGF